MKFVLLEFWSMRTDDGHVLDRESYWKAVLHARSLGTTKGPEVPPAYSRARNNHR